MRADVTRRPQRLGGSCVVLPDRRPHCLGPMPKSADKTDDRAARLIEYQQALAGFSRIAGETLSVDRLLHHATAQVSRVTGVRHVKVHALPGRPGRPPDGRRRRLEARRCRARDVRPRPGVAARAELPDGVAGRHRRPAGLARIPAVVGASRARHRLRRQRAAARRRAALGRVRGGHGDAAPLRRDRRRVPQHLREHRRARAPAHGDGAEPARFPRRERPGGSAR